MKNNINQNNYNNHDYSKIKSLLSTAVMTSLLTFNTQALNALDNNFYDYTSSLMQQQEIDAVNRIKTNTDLIEILNYYLDGKYSDGIEDGFIEYIIESGVKNDLIKYINYQLNHNKKNKSRDDLFQLARLKSKLKNIEINEDIPFEISSGTLELKKVDIDIHKWEIKGVSTKNQIYQVENNKIERLGENKYLVLFKREDSNRIYDIVLEYKGGYQIKFYDINKNNKLVYLGQENIETKEKYNVKGNKYKTEIYKTPGKVTLDIEDLKLTLDLTILK